ncbi:MAG TPA: Gx transporter family protein [Candidatus Ventricola intestinavium]|nr:Gx transporter family protein [Candidatus Ventricola intestinavium]
MRNHSAQRVALSGLLTSLMLVLGLIERQFPITAAIPGVKLGLANSVLLYSLYMLGTRQSIVLMLLKALMSWLIYMNMNAMFYSLAGGVLSLLAMALMKRVAGVSIIGVSALGAVCFNVGQILMAVWMLHTPQLLVTYLPVLMLSGVVTGVLTGMIARLVMKHLNVTGEKNKSR